jgi:transposase
MDRIPTVIAKIRLNFNRYAPSNLYGLYYIIRSIDRSLRLHYTEKYERLRQLTEEDWEKFEEYGLTSEYLHADGEWRLEAVNESGEATGYFTSLRDCEELLQSLGIEYSKN